MEITRGWAFDYGNQKFIVMETGEDLLRLFYERGADDDLAEKLVRHMTTRHAYKILDADVQSIICDTLLQRETRGTDRHKELTALRAEAVHVRDALLDKYLPRLPKEDPAPESPVTG